MVPANRKPLAWVGNSLGCVREFSDAARQAAAFQPNRVQSGQEPFDWKPMESVGSGVKEIRIWAEKGYRVIYLAKFAEAIYVLHAFEKKTQRTSKAELELARRRYRELIQERR
jgi:phage-related protein